MTMPDDWHWRSAEPMSSGQSAELEPSSDHEVHSGVTMQSSSVSCRDYSSTSSRPPTLRSRGLRRGMETRSVLHKATKQFAQTIAERSGDDILALWEQWGDRLDLRCTGAALRGIAKSASLGGDIGPDNAAKFEQLIWQVLEAAAAGQECKRGGGFPRVLSGTAWSIAKL